MWYYSLLDKVMSHNQWHTGMHQCYLMFKVHWRAPHKTIYGHKKKVCLDKTFLLGHFMLHFIMFLKRQMTTKASNGKIFKLNLERFLNFTFKFGCELMRYLWLLQITRLWVEFSEVVLFLRKRMLVYTCSQVLVYVAKRTSQSVLLWINFWLKIT